MNEETNVAEYFDQYEDLAVAVINDHRPNMTNDMEMSNMDMASEICDVLDWEEFDLFTPYDFEKAYNEGTAEEVRAHFYLTHLRLDLFYSAQEHGIGDEVLNRHAVAYSEYWWMRLRDKYEALHAGEPVKHMWLH